MNQNIKVILHNEPHPEDNAMLQALYSRSAESVTDHIEKLKKAGSGKFMSQYYLGYGHASIADCGFITVYVEGISMLAAKAIQDNPLYNGQESSSRYIDWSNQPFFNPYVGTKREETVNLLLNFYRNFYISQKPVIVNHLKSIYPKKEDEKESVYEKAILAKAFDILRGFLPCGATTNVAWTTSLRKANEHLSYLSLHPLKEVRDIAGQLHSVLYGAYPNSIVAKLPVYEEADDYSKDLTHYYSSGFDLLHSSFSVKDKRHLKVDCLNNSIELTLPELYSKRPRKALLPKHNFSLMQCMDFYFKIDFGSYRDLQRHRGGYCSVPAIDNEDGFHPWYYEQLPLESQLEANRLFAATEGVIELILREAKEGLQGEDLINSLTEAKLKNQYFLPMGTLVNINLHYNIHQILYVAQLRSGQTVHATLRPVAQEMGKFLTEKLGIRADCDYSPDEWTLRRGSQDIVAKVV